MVYRGGGAWGLDQAQLGLLVNSARSGVAKLAVVIDTATPYLWCTGYEGLTETEVRGSGSGSFVPRGMKIPTLNMTTSDSSSTLIVSDIPDPDATPYQSLEHHNYTERFSGLTAEWYMGFINEGSWVEIYSMSWFIKQCHWREGQFRFQLVGSTGMYPRAGLQAFSRKCNLIYKGTYCSTGSQSGFGSYDTCSGSKADCELRHGAEGAGNLLPFMGMEWAPEPGQVIKFNEYSSYSFGYGCSGRGLYGGDDGDTGGDGVGNDGGNWRMGGRRVAADDPGDSATSPPSYTENQHAVGDFINAAAATGPMDESESDTPTGPRRGGR